MASTILILGASGALGMHLVKESKKNGFLIRALTHSQKGISKVQPYTNDIWCLDASAANQQLQEITKGVDYVISALGKSISLFNPTPNSFYENNYKANVKLVAAAKKHQVKKFLYVSMKGADSASQFTIPRTHKMVEEELEKSDLEYTIIRPVGFYSGLNDLITMAKRQVIPLVGDGQAKTNSIFQGDLAYYILKNFLELPKLLEIGGPKIHTRKEMAEMIQKRIGGKILTVPTSLARAGSEFSKLISEKELGNKLAYFTHIMSHDMIGEKKGMLDFDEYLKEIELDAIK